MADAVFRAESGIYSGANSTFAANVTVSGNLITGNLSGTFANGNSSISIPAANGNINLNAGGNTTPELVITTTGANVNGNLTVSGTTVTRISVIADGTTFAANSATTDIASQVNTQVAGTLTVSAPTGTPANGQKLMFKIRSANQQTFSWDPIFTFSTDLPNPGNTTGSNKTDYAGFIFDSTTSTWQMIAKNFGF